MKDSQLMVFKAFQSRVGNCKVCHIITDLKDMYFDTKYKSVCYQGTHITKKVEIEFTAAILSSV